MLLPQHINAPELIELPLLALHRVFDDLPRTSILAIASLKIPHLDDSILTHRTHGHSFPSAAALAAARDWYLLADTIRALTPTPPACQSVWTTINHPSGYNPSAVHASIIHLIDSLSPPSPTYYAQFTPATSNIWDSSTLALARARLATVLRNGQRLQCEKLAQLRRISAIYDTHRTYVKKKLDPHQAPRAQPPLLQRLRRQARMLEQPFWAHRLGRGHGDVKVWSGLGRWVPVPLDRHLGMLLKVLERYPLPDEAMPGVTLAGDGSARKRVRMVPVAPEYLSDSEEYTEVADGGGAKKIKYLLRPARPHTHVYPASMVGSIRTALLGLKHTYAIPGAAPRARTLYTPYSAREHQSGRRALQPRFVQAVENEPRAFAVCWREIEWLEAFLACCVYMAAMQERWSGGVTVAQWWAGREGLCECKRPDI